MKIPRIIFLLSVTGFMFLIYNNLTAFKDGIVGFTKKDGNNVGCVCHQFEPNDSVHVSISGPSTVIEGDTVTYVLKIANGPGVSGGCDISASRGLVYPSALDSSLKREEPFTGAGYELTHKYPKLFTGDTLKFTFLYVVPNLSILTDTIFANGNSVNNDSTSEHDMWNYAENFIVHISPQPGVNNTASEIKSFELNQNYPNPFNPETKISFSLTKPANVNLSVFNDNGRLIAELINNKYYGSGSYSLNFNSRQHDLSSGVYFYKLTADGISVVKKMVIVK